MEALVVKCDILNLSRYQLPKITAPSHPCVVPKLIMAIQWIVTGGWYSSPQLGYGEDEYVLKK